MNDKKKIMDVEKWLEQHKIREVEVMLSDFAGISRGKVMPREKFVKGLRGGGHRMPSSMFSILINSDFVASEHMDDLEEDNYLVPDMDTISVIPWRETPTACVICDLVDADGKINNMAPRQVLQNVLKLYEDKGWQPIVAPEFEFYLLGAQDDLESAPTPPKGRLGKKCSDSGMLSLDGLDEFGDLFVEVYKSCEVMNIPVDTLTQEAGPVQFEINMHHGDPLRVADQAFYFKRLMKQVAQRHGMIASFMSKPYPKEYGNAMHIHQSIIAKKDGKNVFVDKQGNDSSLFHSHIAGLQKYIPDLMPLLAPYINSYLRIGSDMSSPANLHWGVENRSVGLRVPAAEGSEQRVENRIAGADVNPYLVIAASLLAGYLGMIEKLVPTDPLTKSGYELKTLGLPEHFLAGLNNFSNSKVIREYLSDEFVTTYADVKRKEYSENSSVLSPWDIRYLLTNV